MIMSHTTDWKPGKVSQDYRSNYDQIFRNKKDDNPSNTSTTKGSNEDDSNERN